MNKSEITIEDLHARILSFIEKAKTATENIEFDIKQEISESFSLTSIKGMNIFRVIQEAINNAIKYAEASKINISISKNNEDLKISIKDNGTGFDIKTVDLGNGLSNMEKRMSEINGKINISSKKLLGTDIQIICKL
ncbi:sensor histidine kinase [Polaribacter ponticola]|uniref:histidine kinase n=1 Tax=Polaribacter ponticola TaxID=2978475 RepID=A0ABT5SEI4_9FLAO|nr:ATP-binding protein [Polaribacter sp. MSW5]MDD7915841.1 ATP-binding protein [Polaribacter sp. MSW5]